MQLKSKPQQKTKSYENEFQDMMADVESNPNYKAKPKAKTKGKPMTKAEDDLLEEIMKNAKVQPKSKSKPASSSSKPASSSSKPPAPSKPTSSKPPAPTPAPTPPPIKKSSHLKSTTTTGTLIPPSKIGIQKLREEFENAKNKKTLSVADVSSYMKLYDDWRAASSKGDQATKNEKLKDLRLLYKQTLYKTQ